MDEKYSGVGLTVGLGGSTEHGCVALSEGKTILGVCEQERATRLRAAGFNSTGLPDEALDLLLSQAGRTRRDISRYAAAEGADVGTLKNCARIDHHRAHASTAYLSSPFTSAVVVVCDRKLPKVSVWKGAGSDLTPADWPWEGPGFADLYSAAAELLGLGSNTEQRFEALARLEPDHRDARLDSLLKTDGGSLQLGNGWQSRIGELSSESSKPNIVNRAPQAAALQRRIGELFLEFLAKVRSVTQMENLCLGGSFFYHSSINSWVRTSGLFSRVFVPVHPGNAGQAVGAALYESGCMPMYLSPFLGPAYSSSAIKATLENCKLEYRLVTERETVEIAVDALARGKLVGWYEGAMEWGPRALGARSIVGNPFAPYVLENLNRFLKHREPWRGYALSALESCVEQNFSGPSEAPFMECDFRPRDVERFRHILPSPNADIRIHVAGQESPPRFRNLLSALGDKTGIPCVVNTSFNGFNEPIVCSPRDAIRVFYGTGVDVLVLDGFVLTK